MIEFEIAAKLLFLSLIISFVFFAVLFLLSLAEERKQARAGQDSTPAPVTPLRHIAFRRPGQ
jgi:hypothetical protein